MEVKKELVVWEAALLDDSRSSAFTSQKSTLTDFESALDILGLLPV